ncbi:Cdc6/Cdc18 family protein [Halocalculus aciditolerans]|uniref:Orc / cell division control protein 6 n=1 Tax=Halocalculus aciditolerans TaxID=1383812 RepID=A0A830FH31_9EURY|nr:orc1/cdc6 family replication initiation protein [Halocalculus aciditolerans]GGL55276.1 orc / cell division control protein 6 [Halocalculus aciditolerans]
MILHPQVFTDEHLPRVLAHRGGPLAALEQAWRPTPYGQSLKDVLISGPSGVGKTVLARYALTELEDAHGIPWTHVKTMGDTTGDVLRNVLDAYPARVQIHGNEPVDDLVWTLRDVVTDPYVVILDESDDLPETDVLQALAGVAGIATVAIVHHPDEWLARVDHWEAAEHVALDRYHVDELVDILRERADRGLEPGAVDDRQLESIADEVAGVARYGIQSLLAAARLAVNRGHTRILGADVRDSYALAREEIRASNLESLPFHHQVLYALMYELGDASAGDLHDYYDERAPAYYEGRTLAPIKRRERRKKLQKLIDYDLLAGEGQGKGRSYALVDGEVEPLVEPVVEA